MTSGVSAFAWDFSRLTSICCRAECFILVDTLDRDGIADVILWAVNNPELAAEMLALSLKAILPRLSREGQTKAPTRQYEKLGVPATKPETLKM